VFSIAVMRAVRSDVFREIHQSSRPRDKIGQGKVYCRDESCCVPSTDQHATLTECITKLYLGSRMTDADKKKIEEALAQLARQVRLPEGVYARVPHCINTAMRHTRDLTDEWLPDRYPSFQTCHRRFQQWVRSGVMTKIMTALARELSAQGAIDVREAFIDASFAPAKKGGARSEKRNAAREQRSWRLQIVMGCQLLFAQRVPPPTK
jgi:hypothetical protein